jgi:NitT/TauT family transport system ATP-binding protein
VRLRIENLTHRFDDLLVLDNINLDVEEGETIAVIGPSGCGKSTLLSIAGGLLRPSEGRVVLSGMPPADSLNPFTYVFQDFALLPWRTVRGNVSLPLEEHKLAAGERQRRVDAALTTTRLADFADALPRQLSGGMRQRVGIARALAVRPAILFLDEPLSSLDAQTRELLMEDFQNLWLKERTTSVYVTHNLDEAVRLADRVLVLSRRPGRVKAVVTVDISPADRQAASAQADLYRLREQLWGLIRQEALVAEREMTNVKD